MEPMGIPILLCILTAIVSNSESAPVIVADDLQDAQAHIDTNPTNEILGDGIPISDVPTEKHVKCASQNIAQAPKMALLAQSLPITLPTIKLPIISLGTLIPPLGGGNSLSSTLVPFIPPVIGTNPRSTTIKLPIPPLPSLPTLLPVKPPTVANNPPTSTLIPPISVISLGPIVIPPGGNNPVPIHASSTIGPFKPPPGGNNPVLGNPTTKLPSLG